MASHVDMAAPPPAHLLVPVDTVTIETFEQREEVAKLLLRWAKNHVESGG